MFWAIEWLTPGLMVHTFTLAVQELVDKLLHSEAPLISSLYSAYMRDLCNAQLLG